MPNYDSSRDIEGQPPQNANEGGAAGLPSSPIEPTPTPAQAVPQTPQQTEIQAIEDRVRRAERWVIGLTAAIAFFALCQVGVGVFQWKVMSGQLIEMARQYPELQKSANAARDAAAAATQETTLLRQQVVGTMSSSFALNGPELIGDKVRIGWAKAGQVISQEFHASFQISEASFPSLKQSWESQLYNVDQKPMFSSFSEKYHIPNFAASDRQFPTQKHTLIVRGEFRFDDGFGQMFNRQFCAVYFGMYQYTAINEGGSVTQGGFQDCAAFQEKLRQFKQRELP